MRILSALFYLILLSECSDTANFSGEGKLQEEDLLVIDLETTETSSSVQFLRDIFDIEFVPLLVEGDRLIGNIDRISVFGDKIIILDNRLKQVLMFGASGQFVRQIGSNGRGPGEYLLPMGMLTVGERLWVFANEQQSLLSYDGSGEYISRVRVPFFGQSVAKLSDNRVAWYVGYNSDDHNLKITDLKGNLVSEQFPFEQERYSTSFGNTGGITSNSDGVLYMDVADPTIYQVQADGMVRAKYYVNLGGTGWPAHERHNIQGFLRAMHNFEVSFIGDSFYESETFLTFSHIEGRWVKWLFFNKSSGQVYNQESLSDDPIFRITRGCLGMSENGEFFFAFNPAHYDGQTDVMKEMEAAYPTFAEIVGSLPTQDSFVLIRMKVKE